MKLWISSLTDHLVPANCSPRALFSYLFLQICCFILSLYTTGRLVNWQNKCAHSLSRVNSDVRGEMAAFRHLGFDPTRSSTVQSVNLENHTLEPNTKWIGSTVAELSLVRTRRAPGPDTWPGCLVPFLVGPEHVISAPWEKGAFHGNI